MTFPSATIIFTSVNKHNILPCLARKLREVFSDQVTSQDRSQEPVASRSGEAHSAWERLLPGWMIFWQVECSPQFTRPLSHACPFSNESKVPCTKPRNKARAAGLLTPSRGYELLLNFKANSLSQILSFLNFYNFKYLSLPLPQPDC